MVVEAIERQLLGETDALQPGKFVLRLQRVDVSLPFAAVDGFGGGKDRRATAQDEFDSFKALMNGLRDLVADEREALDGFALDPLLEAPAGERREAARRRKKRARLAEVSVRACSSSAIHSFSRSLRSGRAALRSGRRWPHPALYGRGRVPRFSDLIRECSDYALAIATPRALMCGSLWRASAATRHESARLSARRGPATRHRSPRLRAMALTRPGYSGMPPRSMALMSCRACSMSDGGERRLKRRRIQVSMTGFVLRCR